MKILVDIGNSRMKWGSEENGEVWFRGAIDYRKDDFVERIYQVWKDLCIPHTLAVSSVAAKQPIEQLMCLAQYLWPKCSFILPVSSANACGVTNAYRQPETLGIDRWLNLLALNHYYKGPACVVDCGTAITIDFLDEEGLHLGGLIGPGLMLMKKTLMQGTADLPFITDEHECGLADNTNGAIYSGTLYSAVGMIELALSRESHQENVVLTGGDASQIARHLTIKTIIEPDFVLKGLAVYSREIHQP